MSVTYYHYSPLLFLAPVVHLIKQRNQIQYVMQLLQQILHKQDSPNPKMCSPSQPQLQPNFPLPRPQPKSSRSHYHFALNPSLIDSSVGRSDLRTKGKREWFTTFYSKPAQSKQTRPREQLHLQVSRLPIIRKKTCKRRILAEEALSQNSIKTPNNPQQPLIQQFILTHRRKTLKTAQKLEITAWESKEPPWERV